MPTDKQPFELAILSPDNFPLLDKMRKELIEVGYKDDENWNAGRSEGNEEPYTKDYARRLGRGCYYYCLLVGDPDGLAFHNHNCSKQGREQVTLTASNYNEILTRCKEAINK